MVPFGSDNKMFALPLPTMPKFAAEVKAILFASKGENLTWKQKK